MRKPIDIQGVGGEELPRVTGTPDDQKARAKKLGVDATAYLQAIRDGQSEEEFLKVDAHERQRQELQRQNARHFQRPNAIITEMESIPYKDLSDPQREMYVNALAEVGDFKKAYKLGKRADHKMILDALKTHKKDCECKDWTSMEMVNGKPTEVSHSRFFTMRDIWADGPKKVRICNSCGVAKVV